LEKSSRENLQTLYGVTVPTKLTNQKLIVVLLLILVLNATYIYLVQLKLFQNYIASFIISILPILVATYCLNLLQVQESFIIVVAIICSLTYRLMFVLTTDRGIDFFPIDYQIYAAMESVIQHGHLDSNIVGVYLPTFKDFNYILFVYSIYELITGQFFKVIAPLTGAILFPLASIPLLYLIFSIILKNNKEALYATLFSISYIGGSQETILSGSLLSRLMFILSFYSYLKICESEKRILSYILVYLISIFSMVMLHLVDSTVFSITVLVFLLMFTMKKSDRRVSRGLVSSTSFAIVIYLLKLIYYSGFALSEVVSMLQKSLLSPESEFSLMRFYQYGVLVRDPVKYLLNFVLLSGLISLSLYMMVGIIRDVCEKRYHELTLMLIIFFLLLLTAIIARSFVGITDYILRFIFHIFLFVSPFAARGFTAINSITKLKYDHVGITKIIIITTLFLILYVPAASMPTYVYYRAEPLRSDEPIAVPYQWYATGIFFCNYAIFPIKVYGAYNAYYIMALTDEINVNFYPGHPLQFNIVDRQRSFIVLSGLHLTLPDARFIVGKTISRELYQQLLLSSNILYRSNNIFVFMER